MPADQPTTARGPFAYDWSTLDEQHADHGPKLAAWATPITRMSFRRKTVPHDRALAQAHAHAEAIANGAVPAGQPFSAIEDVGYYRIRWPRTPRRVAYALRVGAVWYVFTLPADRTLPKERPPATAGVRPSLARATDRALTEAFQFHPELAEGFRGGTLTDAWHNPGAASGVETHDHP